MDKVFYAENTIFEAFVQDLLTITINLLLALYLMYPTYLLVGVEILRTDGFLILILLTNGNLAVFH